MDVSSSSTAELEDEEEEEEDEGEEEEDDADKDDSTTRHVGVCTSTLDGSRLSSSGVSPALSEPRRSDAPPTSGDGSAARGVVDAPPAL